MAQLISICSADAEVQRIAGERRSQHLVTTFIVTGLLFMLLPGTFLGVWNLLNITQQHGPASISQAWIQAHGQAQIFGWIGSFILGIGFYSLTKMRSTRAFPARTAWASWGLWSAGVLLRWFGGITGDAWKILLPLSAVLQLAAFLLFFLVVRKHRPESGGSKLELWARLVIASTVAFLVGLIMNCVLLFHQALVANSPELPHVFDIQFVTLAVWGILVPTIWGFNARWLPVFLGLPKPAERTLYAAYNLSLIGIGAMYLSWLAVAMVAFFVSAWLAIDALHIWKRAVNPAKLVHVDPRFPWFVRFTYVWLVISTVLGMIAVIWDTSGGIWGASRHAITVGFVAGMVFAIGQRVLPAFCGMRVLWSTRLMFWSLVLLFTGCFLRVLSEPLAYQNLWAPAWKILPVSAVIELSAVTVFAVNMGMTLVQPPAHLRARLASAKEEIPVRS